MRYRYWLAIAANWSHRRIISAVLATLKVSDLARHKLVTVENGLDSNEWHFKDDKQNISTFKARGYLRFDSGDAILRCILNDGGWRCCQPILLGGILPLVRFCLYWKNSWMNAPLFMRFGDRKITACQKLRRSLPFLQELYGDIPYWDAVTEENKGAALRGPLNNRASKSGVPFKCALARAPALFQLVFSI